MTISRYADKFLSFRCAGDVISVIGPMKNTIKEITEMMGVHRYVKHWSVNNPMEYSLVDLCSGNALIPVTAAFSLPVTHAIAIDKAPRKRNWDSVRRFSYVNCNIFDYDVITYINSINTKVILTSAHPCRELARRVVQIYNVCDNIEKLVMMPCCIGKLPYKIQKSLEHQMGLDNLWSLHLAEMANGRLTQDQNVLSPKNRIIIAEKHGNTDITAEESA